MKGVFIGKSFLLEVMKAAIIAVIVEQLTR